MSRDISALKAGRESLRRGTGEQLHHRAHALDEIFFAKRERELLDALRKKIHHEKEVEELARQCGIRDLSKVEALLNCGVQPETMTALVLAPLVEVAWADDKLEGFERAAIVEEALRRRVVPGSAPWRLLQSWLAERPPEALFEAWAGYAHECLRSMSEPDQRVFSKELIEMSRSIAEETRRRRRFDLDRCVNELQVLDAIERALSPSATRSSENQSEAPAG